MYWNIDEGYGIGSDDKVAAFFLDDILYERGLCSDTEFHAALIEFKKRQSRFFWWIGENV